ncbi:RNA 2',3'-cyclic phosphodiesterase [Caldichromatium japonicum]|uniref:RNA 2',3'-cyclic phosphodiesterase n=1 Tax=Caldichromatium japonicum TaxID=2699430 RepID=A0A6G7VD80_9GAMM|nr:RNA 2',3'-cyclic phosphodiesterase [Caldichromatium japonicum]QIK37747.1 RNA 2',3'-cyclic phosphodiesterase [Caldichromatium japonicum]
MSERWFFAIWPDDAVREALLTVLNRSGRLPGRPTHPLDWHLTLTFVGVLPPGGLACVESAATAVRTSAFQMSLERIGHFSGSQVLWCGPSFPPRQLTELAQDLQARLTADCGLRSDPRPYCPHLTLARRVRSAPPLQIDQPIAWTVSEWILAYGVSGSVPRYRVHRRYPLAVDPGAWASG